MQPGVVKQESEIVAQLDHAGRPSSLSEARTIYERCTAISSFDNTEQVSAVLSRPERYKQLFANLSAPAVISRGAGLNYCLASAQSQGRSILSTQFNRFLGFDSENKIVRVEPGVTVGALLEFAIERNLLPPVLPGYPLVTVGGAVAMNIHGKNQSLAGNFGDHVERLTLYHPHRGEVDCSPNVNPELFWLTVGGFGLTGHIISVDIGLKTLPGKRLVVQRHKVNNLVEAGYLMERLSVSADYTYSWHNFNLRGNKFGSGTVYEEHHTHEEPQVAPKKRGVPSMEGLRFRGYNHLTVPLLTRAYQIKENLAARTRRSDLYEAFFPFVGKEIYFRLYGKPGLREYQALFPRDRWEEACRRLADAIRSSGALVMLASIKTFRGERKFLNYSGSGICIALDTPNTPSAVSLFSGMDVITADLGGIANISKDSRLSTETIRAMFGTHFNEFRDALRRYDPEQHFQSELRRRLDV